MLPSASQNVVGTPYEIDFAAQYSARLCPCQRFACRLATSRAWLGVRMVRYSFPV